MSSHILSQFWNFDACCAVLVTIVSASASTRAFLSIAGNSDAEIAVEAADTSAIVSGVE